MRSKAACLSLLWVTLAASSAYSGSWEPAFTTPASRPGSAALQHWSIPPDHAEKALTTAPYRVVSVEGAGAGVTGAKRVDLVFAVEAEDEDEVYLWTLGDAVRVKSKPFPTQKLDGWNNSPRKEIAAYEAQKLFLDPDDYVVPTTIAVSVPLDLNRRLAPRVQPTLDGTRSVLHAIALWLRDVTVPEVLYDEKRFRADPDYAYRLASFNVLTYLINHKDNRKGNFLVSKDDTHRQVFAIDNGIAFDSWIFNWFIPSSYAWRKIVVPAVPSGVVKRLRNLVRADLDYLAVVAEFEIDPSGLVQPKSPGRKLEPKRAVVIRDGHIQLGLSRGEIDEIWERIEDLLADVDDGKIAVF